MAVDIRIAGSAFDFAGAWIRGVEAGQRQSALDLQWEKWANDAATQLRNEQRDQNALDEAKAKRDSAAANANDAAYQADVAKAPALSASLSGRANYIMSRLIKEHGLTTQGAAALTGNWTQESTLNTVARNRGDGKDGSDSIGLGQWNSERARALKTFAQSRGQSWTDLNTQIDFAASELKNNKRFAGVYAALTNPNVSLAAASQEVHFRYEVAERSSAGRRLNFSMQALKNYDPTAQSARALSVRNSDGSVGVYSSFPVGKEQFGPNQSEANAPAQPTQPGFTSGALPSVPNARMRRTTLPEGVTISGAPAAPATPGVAPAAPVPFTFVPTAPTVPALPQPPGVPAQAPGAELAPPVVGNDTGTGPVLLPPINPYGAAPGPYDIQRQILMPDISPPVPLQRRSDLQVPEQIAFDPYAYFGMIG